MARPRFHPLVSKTAFPALVTFAGLLAAFAAGSEALAQNEGWWPAVFRDTTRVTVIHLDVTVTDRAGRPVHGLEKEDFQLFEDGEPVEIRHFLAVEGGSTRMLTVGGEEESGEAATAPGPERRLHLINYCWKKQQKSLNQKMKLSNEL